MSSHILVLEQPPGEEEGLAKVRDAIAEIGAAGFLFFYTSAEELSEAANRYLWLGSKGGEEIAVVDDFDIEVRYLELVLTSEERTRRAVALLTERLPVVSVDELKERARTTFAEDPAALVRLALGAGDGDDDTTSVIGEATKHENPRARRAAAMSTMLIRSPRLAALLREAHASEPDETLRDLFEHAANVAESPVR